MRGKKVAVIGECMLELSSSGYARTTHKGNDLPFSLSYGGDTLNTAVYLSRLGIDVDYFTALGDDGYSDWLINQWQSEGVGCDYVQRIAGRLPGIYAIETDDAGERSFHYWRDQSPVKELFDTSEVREQLFQNLLEFDLVYLSGITLSLFKDSIRKILFDLLKSFREKGGLVVFDSNYRPKGWQDRQQAREVYDDMYSLTDIALPTLDDEQALYGQDHKQEVVERLSEHGVKELILKQGLEGCLAVSGGMHKQLPLKQVVRAVDSTAAGDSFNAGYLANKLKGASVKESVEAGQALSALVVQHPGAIISSEQMSEQVLG